MERTLTAPLPRTTLLARLRPLARWGVALLLLVGILGTWLHVRIEATQLRHDLDRTARATLEARVLHDRLTLELQTRRRAVAMEKAAAALGLNADATLIRAPGR